MKLLLFLFEWNWASNWEINIAVLKIWYDYKGFVVEYLLLEKYWNRIESISKESKETFNEKNKI